ncbi:MFS transporter [Gluconacetobacter tumulisoli]|uniref:MFS transporter n=1 Tax=Gluconacetobacter tumulisoli TaxID=1286189 RepID=A0A7W4K4J4_9PROT|nr:MFS transporter [Gluconacetobacter tumulisoli]MBB2200072.1 MFS transporter [Gluconacetobacter tumulisoli]
MTARPEEHRAVGPAATDRPGLAGHPYSILCVLCLFSMLDSIDEGGLSLVIDRIRHDLSLTHVEVSFILGFASTAITSLLLLPAGLLVDSVSRKRLLFGMALVWSGMSFMNGIANGFWRLLFARSGSAAADAILKPGSQSILRDVFPPERRGLPFSLYWGSFSLGNGISFYLSGSLIRLADSGFFRAWPVVGRFLPWQIVLGLPGMCTLPLAFVILLIREPAREARAATAGATLGDTVRFIRSYWWLYWPSFAYSIVWSIPNAGYLWTPTVLTESWKIPEADVGHMIGLLGIVMSIAGTLGGGWLVDALSSRGIRDVAIRVSIVASALMAFFQTAILHVYPPWQVFSLISLMYVFQGTINASYYVAIASVTPGRFMGRMFALQFICLSLPGALAPTLIAMTARHVPAHAAMASAVNLNVGFGSVVYLLLLLLFSYRIHRFRQGAAGDALSHV